MKKLFVGQLSYSTTEESLRSFFGNYSGVNSVKVIMDPMSGRSRGFGFVEFSDDSQAEQAISALNGTNLDGRDIIVNEARPQAERSGGGGRGGSSRSFSRERSSFGADAPRGGNSRRQFSGGGNRY